MGLGLSFKMDDISAGGELPRNGRAPVPQLVQHDAEREEVSAMIEGPCLRSVQGDMYGSVPTMVPTSVPR
jgi:hypothetical protein